MSLDFVAIDFETANRSAGSPCAVGLVRVAGGSVVDTATTLMRPPEPHSFFEPWNTRIHGITQADVADAPAFADIWPELVSEFADVPWIAHNAPFDMGVIRGACDAAGLPWPTLTFTCSLSLSRRAFDLPSYSLPMVADAVGCTMDNHHDAGADALAAAEIMMKITQKLRVDSLDEVLAELRVAYGTMAPGLWTGSKALRRPKPSLP